MCHPVYTHTHTFYVYTCVCLYVCMYIKYAWTKKEMKSAYIRTTEIFKIITNIMLHSNHETHALHYSFKAGE